MRSRYIDQYELMQLQRVLTPMQWLPFAISLETGLRVGDVVKLTWDEIHGARIDFVAEKTGKRGVVYVSRVTELKLGELRRYSRSGWVFPSPHDPCSHITRQALWKRLKVACRRLGVNDAGISPHAMRKVCGVRTYHEKGIAAAREQLQHKDTATTEIYTLSDWLTGENATLPLKRGDLLQIVRMVLDHLGEKP